MNGKFLLWLTTLQGKRMTLEEWFDTKLWPYYRSLSHLHDDRPGIKKKAWERVEKMNLTEEDMTHIYDKTLALAKYDMKRRQSNKEVDRWPHLSTYLNQGYFDREIDRYSDLARQDREKEDKESCQCGLPVTHPMGNCYICYSRLSEKHDPLRTEKIEVWKRHGLAQKTGETNNDYRVRMMETAKRNARNIGKL